MSIDGIYYSLDNDNCTASVLSVSNIEGDLIIKPEITYQDKTYKIISIGDGAFINKQALTSIEIPNSVIAIGMVAFYGCTGLTSIKMSDSITTIGKRAFYGCTSLTSVELSNSLISIGEQAFYGCIGLTSIKIPDSVTTTTTTTTTTIGVDAFYGCSGLTNIELPNSVTNIEQGAFYNCSSLSSVELSNSLISIGKLAFYGCASLTSIKIPDSVTTIGSMAFYNCTSLANIILPEKIATIESATFFNCSSLSSVEIPNSVISIEGSAFSQCSSLSSIEIPNSVISIGRSAFFCCTSLTSIKIPNSVTTIANDSFGLCDDIETFVIEDGDTEIDFYSPFNATNIKTLYLGRKWRFYSSSSSENNFGEHIILAEHITEIPQNAFLGLANIKSIDIPNSVTSIGKNAFEKCYGLTELLIPESVTQIGESAFSNCTGLTEIILPENLAEIGAKAFYNCYNLCNIKIPKSITKIDDGVFQECSRLTGIKISDSIVSIGNNAFNGCSELKEIILPQSVNYVGSNAFKNCTGLKKSVYPSTIKNPFTNGDIYCYDIDNNYLKDGIIYNADSSEIKYVSIDIEGEFVIPPSIKSVRTSAFDFCDKINGLRIEDGEQPILFSDDCGLKQTVITDSYIGRDWSGEIFTRNLKTVTLSEYVSSIPTNAFYECWDLAEINSLNPVPPSIEDKAFSYSNYNNVCVTVPEQAILSYQFSQWGSFSQFKGDKGTYFHEFNDDFYRYRMISATEVCLLSKCNIGSYTESIPSRTAFGQSFYFVTVIGEKAFKGQGLKSLILPSTVRIIMDNAFEGCENLQELSMPSSLESIETEAFIGCKKLSDIKFNDELKSIGPRVFKDCVTLESVKINDNLELLPESAFEGCVSLTTADTGSSLVKIADNAFAGCTSLKEINMGDGLREIGAYVFDGCTSIKSLTFGNNVERIGEHVFNDCSGLTSITMSRALRTVGNKAFAGCTGLRTVYAEDIKGDNPWAKINFEPDSLGIYHDETTPCSYAGSVVDPNTRRPLTNITINGISKLNPLVFAYNSNLTEITVATGTIIEEIGERAFYRCTGLKKIKFNNEDKNCGYNRSRVIGPSAFEGCTKLSSFVLPSETEELGSRAFANCPVLTTFTLSESPDMIIIPDDTFYGNYLKVLNIGRDFESRCFAGSNLTTLNFYGSIGHINDNTFEDSNIKEVYFESSVRSIGNYAFQNCKDLNVVSFGPSVRTIGNNAFKNCTSLSVLTIGDGVEEIGDCAFIDCRTMKEVYFGQSVHSIGKEAFKNTQIKKVAFGSGLKDIGDEAFCYGYIEDLILPPHVETIGKRAFYGNKLRNIAMGYEIKTIGDQAFNYDKALESVSITAHDAPAAVNTTFKFYDTPLYVMPGELNTYYNCPICWYRFTSHNEMTPAEAIMANSSSNIKLKPGESITLTAEIKPVNVSLPYIFWHSTNTDIATVDCNGKVTYHGSSDVFDTDTEPCRIIAETLFDGIVTEYMVNGDSSDVDDIFTDSHADITTYPCDIYNIQGILIKREATEDDIRALKSGFYIIGNKKTFIK